jgi:hypothetical protein
MKGYEKCLRMTLDVLPKGFDLNYKDGTSPLFYMVGDCEYDFSLEFGKSISQCSPDKLLHRIKVPYEEATQKYGNDGGTALSLILTNEYAFNDVMREDLAEAYVVQRTYDALCRRRQVSLVEKEFGEGCPAFLTILSKAVDRVRGFEVFLLEAV